LNFPFTYSKNIVALRLAAMLMAGLFICSLPTVAQSVSGKWYGTGRVVTDGEHDIYLTELIIHQKSTRITGVLNYYFRKQTYSHVIAGSYDSKTRKLTINPIPLLFYKSSGTIEADCWMRGNFTLLVSRLEESISGSFSATENYKYTCPNINFKFLKERPSADSDEEPTEDTIASPVEIPEQKEAIKKLASRPADFITELGVDSPTVKLFVFDNGEVDDDTITLFYRNQLLASKIKLTETPIVFELKVDTTDDNYITMYAENLGKLPPNTALYVIMDGEKRLEVSVASDFKKSGTIRIRQRKYNPYLIR